MSIFDRLCIFLVTVALLTAIAVPGWLLSGMGIAGVVSAVWLLSPQEDEL